MITEESIPYTWKEGYLNFTLKKLNQFDGIVMEK